MDLYERRGGTKEISLRYGYRSPDSFARAFSAMHGISPATAIEGKIAYTTWPRMTFYLTIKGGSGMDVRLENKSDFNIVGFTKRIPILFEGVNPEIQSMVNSLSDDDWALLDHLSDTEPRGIVQAMTNYDESRMNGNGSCDYYIGTATTRHSHGDLTVLQVPATTWAIFRSIGLFPQALQETWGRIYSEWFPSVEYELNDGPELLRTEHDELTDEDMVWEIWIPVRKTT
jgi:AraC family transcriptional regulator